MCDEMRQAVRACTSWLCCCTPGRHGPILGSFHCSPQIPIAVSGIRGMGFLMKYHIETGAGQLPPRLSSLLIKVSAGCRAGGGGGEGETGAPGLNTLVVL